MNMLFREALKISEIFFDRARSKAGKIIVQCALHSSEILKNKRNSSFITGSTFPTDLNELVE